MRILFQNRGKTLRLRGAVFSIMAISWDGYR
jgi:hypothetical protein